MVYTSRGMNLNVIWKPPGF